MPNVLLTFLGRNKYVPCVYQNAKDPSKTSTVVRFVQEAIVQHHCQSWTANDRILVFVTNAAREANWDGTVYAQEEDKEGLNTKLQKLKVACRIEAIEVADGDTEHEIWENFQTIFDQLHERDKVHLDITNAFRSIPLFATTLLDYARFLKNIRIESIYYGMFESLGPAFEVVKNYPNPADRIAPMLDLKGLIQLQDWTNAANDFLKHGNPWSLGRLSEQTKLPEAISFGKHLRAFGGAFSTVRGGEITTGRLFADLQTDIQNIKANAPLEPLVPILDKITEGLSPFTPSKDILNGFRAIEWCIDHELVQQGITLMREAIVSYISDKYGLDFSNKSHRAVVEKAFTIKTTQLPHRPTPDIVQRLLRRFDVPKGMTLEEFLQGVTLIVRDSLFRDLQPIYEEISFQYRNDINHGGYMSNAKNYLEFVGILRTKFDELKKIINF
jgi:CRISPR-associated Csx2 family protein